MQNECQTPEKPFGASIRINMQKMRDYFIRVEIPDALAAEIEKRLSTPGSTQDFVLEAVREKLSWEDRRREFHRLSDKSRATMAAKGLSETDILKDFEDFRHRLSGSDLG
jgi:hypothetical protein